MYVVCGISVGPKRRRLRHSLLLFLKNIYLSRPGLSCGTWDLRYGMQDLFILFFKLIYFLKIYLFIYLWLSWVFVDAQGLSLVAASGGYSSLQCAGFSLRWLLLLQSMDSRHVGSRAQAQ